MITCFLTFGTQRAFCRFIVVPSMCYFHCVPLSIYCFYYFSASCFVLSEVACYSIPFDVIVCFFGDVQMFVEVLLSLLKVECINEVFSDD